VSDNVEKRFKTGDDDDDDDDDGRVVRISAEIRQQNLTNRDQKGYHLKQHISNIAT
jgi:hypothetical protein